MTRALIIFGITLGVMLGLGAALGRFDTPWITASLLTGVMFTALLVSLLHVAGHNKAAQSQINRRRSLAATAYDAVMALGTSKWKSEQSNHLAILQVIQPALAFEAMRDAEWWVLRVKDFYEGRLHAHADTLTALRRAGVLSEDPFVDRILEAAVKLNGPDFEDAEIIAIIGEIRDIAEASARQNSPPA